MKSRRLITELVLALVCVGCLGWQQWTIQALRRGRPDPAGAAALVVPVPMPAEPGRPDAGLARSRSPGGPAARTDAKRAPDLTALQDEIRALRQENEALAAARELQTGSSTLIRTGEGGVAELLLTSVIGEVETRPPDTTGLRPDGQAASWSPRQVLGAPDTPGAGDLVTAWASRSPDGGEEWLQLSYERPVDIAQINVHETYNPGAVSRITALLPDGSEKTLWEGTEPPEQAPVEVGFPVPPGVRSDQIKVYMDTARVPGWNEVDAVELVGSDGSRQWATGSSASSYFGDRR